MGDVEFPDLVLGAELCGLFEDLLDGGVVLLVPVQLCLHHEHRDVLIKLGIILLECRVDGLTVAGKTRVLNRLRLLPQRVNMLVGEIFKLAVGLLRTSLVENEIFKEFEVLLR